MALNLVRNSRVFFTTNISAVSAGSTVIGTPGIANTSELQVLDGFSFSQSTNSDTISVSEAGINPTRGQRNFNSSLAPVDFSFTTYIRPRLSGSVLAEESFLWNALFNAQALNTTAVSATCTALTRATTNTGVFTMVGTVIPATVQGVTLAAGVVLVMGGLTGTFANEWNSPFKITTVSGTTIVGEFSTAPAFGAGTTPSTTASTATLSASAWTQNAAVAADTAKPAAYALATTARSNVNQLQPFGMIISVDQTTYVLDNCALNQAVIDFGLDGIASIQWSGNATAIRNLVGTTMVDGGGNVTMTGGIAGTAVGKVTTANYLTNKLSTAQLISNIGGVGGTTYTLALTGGSITFNNNISYVTPANIGVVNLPISYYTGNLAISGSVTAYMNTGAGVTGTGALLAAILASVSTASGVETKYRMEIDIGGLTNTNRVEVEMDGCMLSIPTIETSGVVSTTINFNAQGSLSDQTTATASYDLGSTNYASIRYFSA
jgi:hypothetical protein